MQRARRLASVAVVAFLAVAGLSACRQEASVAAYVGNDARITEARVQSLWDDTKAAFDAAPPPAPAQAEGGAAVAPPTTLPITRSDVVRTLLGAQVMDEVAKKQSLQLPADLTLADYATALRLPPTTEYVRLFARTDTYIKLLRQKAQNAPAISDADLREVFDVLAANQGIDAGTGFEQFKGALPAENKQLVQGAVEVRKEINEVSAPMNIKINPRYQPLGIPVLEFQTQAGDLRPLVVAPLGSAADTAPVADIS
jgi:hypothetical protein